MTNDAAIDPKVEELRSRLRQMYEVTTRIDVRPEAEPTLQLLLDGLRAIVDASYALLVLVDHDLEPRELLASGLTSQQSEELPASIGNWEPYRPMLEYEEALRVEDLQGYLRGRGLPDPQLPFELDAPTSYLTTPVVNREQRIGSFHLVGKDGGFSEEDELTLAMFAAQSALVISGARRYQQAQRARADLEALVSTAPLYVLVLDAKTGDITSMNDESRRLIGDRGVTFAKLQEAVYAGSYRRADGQVISEEGIRILDALQTGEVVRDEEMILEFADGRSLVALVNATPIRAADGTVESVVVTGQDIGSLAEIERLRSEFLGMIGHELRTPLAAIKGSVTTLRQGESSLDPAEMDQFFRVIDEQADYMRDLLSDLMDMVRIETGTLGIKTAPVQLARLVDEARSVYLGSGGRHNLSIHLPEDLPWVMAERRRVVQVVTNLLINASRHTHEASTIRIEASHDDAKVLVSVVDSGKGLSPERLPHLFAKFSQPDAPDETRDLGLGLAICKGIVEAHGGHIWAQSDGPGLGSRFTFTLPEAPSETAEDAADASGGSRRRRRAETGRVLAVDDNPRELKLVRDTLADAGFEVTVTGNPDDVAALVEENAPHVVLLDVMLAGAHGIDLMREIHAVADVPVIFLSAYDHDELIVRAFEFGARDYITKPFTPAELAARIRSAMRAAPSHLPADDSPTRSSGTFALGEMRVDFAERSVTVAGRAVELTPTEFTLLGELCAHQGVPLSHEHLLREIWGLDDTESVQRMRTVVKNLRRKLGDGARKPRYIVTVPRVGYRMPKTVEVGPDH